MLRFYNIVRCMNHVKNINTHCLPLTSNKDCGENYISEIISNFNKFSESPRKKYKAIQNDNLSINKKVYSYSKDVEKSENFKVKKQKFNSKSVKKQRISSKDIEKLGINIDNSIQETIDYLFKQGEFESAKDLIIYNVKQNHIPSFRSLRTISSMSAQKGDSGTIKIVQNVAKTNYSLLYKNANCFDHYLCEALCREGNYKESFALLSSLIEDSTNFKRVKESATFIMMLVPTMPEEYQDKALLIANKFLQRRVLRPIIMLWRVSFMSDIYHLHCISNKIIEENATLLDEEEECISGMIEEAASRKDPELLHRLMELTLRLKSRELLQKVVSALLNLYCMMENLSKASRLLKFSTEENLHIPSEIGQKYLDLLNGAKKQSTKISSKIANEMSNIKFKF